MLLGAARIPPKGWRPFLGPATFPENKKTKEGMGKSMSPEEKRNWGWENRKKSRENLFSPGQQRGVRKLATFV